QGPSPIAREQVLEVLRHRQARRMCWKCHALWYHSRPINRTAQPLARPLAVLTWSRELLGVKTPELSLKPVVAKTFSSVSEQAAHGFCHNVARSSAHYHDDAHVQIFRGVHIRVRSNSLLTYRLIRHSYYCFFDNALFLSSSSLPLSSPFRFDFESA